MSREEEDMMSNRRKLLIQMSGAPGSGKSTLASLLSQSVDAVVVDHDLIRSFFLDNTIAFDQSAKMAYDLQWVLARNLLQHGRSVIIDSTCNYQETLNKGTALAQQYGAEYWYIECRINDIGLLDARLQNRVSPMRSQRTGVQSPPPDANQAQRSHDEFIALFRKWIDNPVRPACNIIAVESVHKPQDCLHSILGKLRLSTDGRASISTSPSMTDGSI